MHPHFADGALPLQVGVGLTRMAVTPRQLLLFCSGTLPPSVAKAMETGFLPALDKDQAYMFTVPVRVAPAPTRSGPQVTNPGYPGLSQFIW